MRENGTIQQWLSLYVSYRSPLEPLIMWCTQNANHPGCPGGVDQCGDYPSLGLGKFPSSGRSETTAAFITGAAQRHWVPKVSPFPACQAPCAGSFPVTLMAVFWEPYCPAKTDVGMANRKLNESTSRGTFQAFHESRPTQCLAELACYLLSGAKQRALLVETNIKSLPFTENNSL